MALLRQAITHREVTLAVMAQSSFARCYMEGNGVDADTMQAAF